MSDTRYRVEPDGNGDTALWDYVDPERPDVVIYKHRADREHAVVWPTLTAALTAGAEKERVVAELERMAAGYAIQASDARDRASSHHQAGGAGAALATISAEMCATIADELRARATELRTQATS